MVLTTPESIIEKASTQNLLDDLIDESVRTSSRRPIMMQFDPSSGWIWRRWKGTVFSETWTSAVRNMVLAAIVILMCNSLPQIKKDYFMKFDTLWGQLLSVTTFTLTFFLNQSYALWRKCYGFSRRLQGRLNDLGMTMAAHAARGSPEDPDEPSTYTFASRQLLLLVSRYIRLFNLLMYASFTRSHRPVLTPRGMRRLVERGLITGQERQVLVDAQVPPTQRHNAVLIWIARLFEEGRQAGHFQGSAGFEEQFLEKFHVIRAQYGGIGDELQGRMPLAYAHIVQVLVDVVLWLYPFMAYCIGMTPLLGVLGTGFLTMSYQGLFDLAKQFLDPYDNESYGKGDDPLCVDTLIAETNAGSVRWMNGFEEMPFSSQKIKDGVALNQLPLRGYSVEKLAQMELERLQKEKEAEEQREKEEKERRQREKEAAELMELEEGQELIEDKQLQEEFEEEEEAEVEHQMEEEQIEEEHEEVMETPLLPNFEKVEMMASGQGVTPDVIVNGLKVVDKVISEIGEATKKESDEADRNEVPSCSEEEDDDEEGKVHTVTSIDGGIPVTLEEPECELVVEEEMVDAVNGDVNKTEAFAESPLLIPNAEANVTRTRAFGVADEPEDATTKPELDLESRVAERRAFGVVKLIEEEETETPERVKGEEPVDRSEDERIAAASEEDNFETIHKMMGADQIERERESEEDKDYLSSAMEGGDVWEEEKVYHMENLKEQLEVNRKEPMTAEEYTLKAQEILDQLEDELHETEEILNAPPGADAYIEAKEKKPRDDDSDLGLRDKGQRDNQKTEKVVEETMWTEQQLVVPQEEVSGVESNEVVAAALDNIYAKDIHKDTDAQLQTTSTMEERLPLELDAVINGDVEHVSSKGSEHEEEKSKDQWTSQTSAALEKPASGADSDEQREAYLAAAASEQPHSLSDFQKSAERRAFEVIKMVESEAAGETTKRVSNTQKTAEESVVEDKDEEFPTTLPEEGDADIIYELMDSGDGKINVVEDPKKETGEAKKRDFRSSEMEGHEVWEEEKEYLIENLKEELMENTKEPMSAEEYSLKAQEIMERLESELQETEDILKAPPGADACLEAKEKKPKESEPSPVLNPNLASKGERPEE